MSTGESPAPAGWTGTVRTKSELTEVIKGRGAAVLVINTRSRRGGRLFSAARNQLSAAGFQLTGSFAVTDPGTLTGVLCAALDLKPDLLVLGGGDGSMSEAVKHLAGRDVALGVLPLGTTNNFARSLGIPLRLSGAIDILRTGKVADVDLGRAGEHVFANLASLGVSVEVATHVRPMVKRVLGRAAYPLTALALLPRHRPFTARLTIGDQVYAITTHQLNIANGSHHAGRAIAPDTGLDDRQLVVYRLGDATRLRLTLATVRQAITGPRRPLAHTPFLTTRQLWLETEPPLHLDVDGEIRGSTPVQITLDANALRVMVASGFPDR